MHRALVTPHHAARRPDEYVILLFVAYPRDKSGTAKLCLCAIPCLDRCVHNLLDKTFTSQGPSMLHTRRHIHLVSCTLALALVAVTGCASLGKLSESLGMSAPAAPAAPADPVSPANPTNPVTPTSPTSPANTSSPSALNMTPTIDGLLNNAIDTAADDASGGTCCVNKAFYTCSSPSALKTCFGEPMQLGSCASSCPSDDSDCPLRCVEAHGPDPSQCTREVTRDGECKQ
jgi:hypothetical protein